MLIDFDEMQIKWYVMYEKAYSYTVGKNYGMNQNFAYINPDRDF